MIPILFLALALSATSPQQAGGDDGFIISADTVEGSEGPEGRVVELYGNVSITRRGAVLTGARGTVYEDTGLAVIRGNVRGTDGPASIACDSLRYYRDDDVAVLTGNASYADTSVVARARRIDIYRLDEIAVFSGDVVAEDVDGEAELTAQRLVYDAARGEARSYGDPVLTTYDDEGAIDAVLRGDVIEMATETETIRAFGSTRIETRDVMARAGVATLFGEDERIVLDGSPSVQQDTDRMSGGRVVVATADGEIERVDVTGGARADYTIEPDEPGGDLESGYVAGDSLTMYFANGDPVRTFVRGRAESEHAVGLSGERNTLSARTIDVRFSEGRINRATFRGNAQGVYVFVPEDGGETAGSDTTAFDRVAYASTTIDYYVPRNRIVLTKGARVEYKSTELRAGRIEFDPEEELMIASESPDLLEEGERLVGSRLGYDLSDESGAVVGGVTTFEEGLYAGDWIVRESDGSLSVRDGVYTTCADEHPHYRLVASRMRIYLDDKVVARPVILYIGEIPVLALPFYVFPIRKDRHSGFLIPTIEVGLSGDKGRFVRNFGYYWAPNDYVDVSAWADYYEQTRWVGHLKARYKVRYALSGSVESSFTDELAGGKRRWDLKVTHRQEFGRHWTAGASGDFRSDAAYATDTNQTIEESVNRSLHSQLWFRGRWSGVSVGVTLDRREELDQDRVSELLPKADISFSSKPILSAERDDGAFRKLLSEISVGWRALAVNDRDTSGDDEEVHQGVGVSMSLRSSIKAFRWVNLTPRLNIRANVYDRGRDGGEFPTRVTYDAGVSAGTTVYGTFMPEIGPVRGVRHIVEPSASFSWTPEFSQYFEEDGTDRFYSFSGFGGTPGARKSLSLSLVNRLQVKLSSGDDTRKLDNLARLSFRSSYDFRRDDERWSDLSSGFELRPGRALSFRWSGRHDPYDGWAIQNSSLTTTVTLNGSAPAADRTWEDRVQDMASPSPVDELRQQIAERARSGLTTLKPWSASMTFRYSRGASSASESYWVDGSVAFSPTPKWRLNYSLHYDLEAGEVASQEYTIYRDLHCWEAQFTRRYYNDEWQYYFRISVKALPELQAESGERYLSRGIR
ncbi:MAG: LPS assembly protein LptD [Candidatus Eisenbacteria bacterium]|nr:LPS assembly protein LptD [Candidatus Eisenbacteria bacterium]